jgi:hypothetical protein
MLTGSCFTTPRGAAVLLWRWLRCKVFLPTEVQLQVGAVAHLFHTALVFDVAYIYFDNSHVSDRI